jgi:hypothetical protein
MSSVPTSFIKPRWRKVVQPAEGTVDSRAYKIAVIVHLRERLGSGGTWVDGSRAYRTLDDYQLPVPAFEVMRADGELRLAVPTDFPEWYEERRTLLARCMTEAERGTAAGELVGVTIERGHLLISSIRRSPSNDAEALKARLTRCCRASASLTCWSKWPHGRASPIASSIRAAAHPPPTCRR